MTAGNLPKDSPSHFSTREYKTARTRQAADYVSILADLQDCIELFDLLESFDDSTRLLIKRACAEAMLVKFVACFRSSKDTGSGKRASLAEGDVYAKNPEYRAVFRHFLAIRNQYVVHDALSLRKVVPIALIGDAPDFREIEIRNLIAFADFTTDAKFPMLRSVMEAAQAQVQIKFEKATSSAMIELRSLSPTQRANLPFFKEVNLGIAPKPRKPITDT